MNKGFFKTFDKKRFMLVSELIFVLAGLVAIVNIIGKTYTRYETEVDVNAEASVAIYVLDQGTYESSIALSGLTPSLEPKYYTFYVSNYDTEHGRSKVDLDYKIRFETTTNMPLVYEIVRNETFTNGYTNIITQTQTIQDEDNVFFKVFKNDDTYSLTHTRNVTDQYTIKVIFPESYKNSPDSYQGIIELFSIIVDASQVA